MAKGRYLGWRAHMSKGVWRMDKGVWRRGAVALGRNMGWGVGVGRVLWAKKI